MAAHLREQRIDPELVLCSSARRARQTLEGIEPALGKRTVHVEGELYAASAAELVDRLRRVPRSVRSVLVIGHNPGLQRLVLELARPGPERRAVEEKFPTAALATLAFDGSRWEDLDSDSAELIAFAKARDLER
jgi:phosphohistidine phosphatase